MSDPLKVEDLSESKGFHQTANLLLIILNHFNGFLHSVFFNIK